MTQENEKFKATSVADYRSKIGEQKEVTLPSGAVFILKRLTPLDYIKEGLADIPNEFVQFIAEVQSGVSSKQSSEDQRKNVELFENFLRVTIEKGVISPLICMKYEKEKEDTHLVFGELETADQSKIINVILGKE